MQKNGPCNWNREQKPQPTGQGKRKPTQMQFQKNKELKKLRESKGPILFK